MSSGASRCLPLFTALLAVWLALVPALTALAGTHAALHALDAAGQGRAAVETPVHAHTAEAVAGHPSGFDHWVHELAHGLQACGLVFAWLPPRMPALTSALPAPTFPEHPGRALPHRASSPFRPPIR